MGILSDQLSSTTLLKKSWRSVLARKSKKKRKSKGIDGISLDSFSKNSEKLIDDTANKLSKGKFSMSKLRAVPIKKSGKSKDRLITIPIVEDRIVHKAILSLLAPIFHPSINNGVSYCGVSKSVFGKRNSGGYNTKEAIKKIISLLEKGDFFVVKCDIQSFFDNVSKKKIYEQITRGLGADTSINNLLEQIIYFEVDQVKKLESNSRIDLPKKDYGVAQGNSLSPLFSNIYLREFDKKIKNLFGYRYIRYVDDFVIICQSMEEASKCLKTVEALLREEELELSTNTGKSEIAFLKTTPVVFLGLKFTRQKITTKFDNSEITKLFNRDILNINSHHYSNVRREDMADAINRRISGWVEYYKYYHVTKSFELINRIINSKRRTKRFKGLQRIDLGIIEEIISEQKWARIFS